MRKSNRLPRFCTAFFFFVALVPAVGTHAQSFCFLSATTFYEQVYCELQAKGEARGLPPFYQFKRNDEKIQAVLLKRPAARAGIELPKRTRSIAPLPRSFVPDAAGVPAVTSAARESTSSPSISSPGNDDLAGCVMRADSVECNGVKRFQLVGNRINHRLSATALTEENKMGLPVFTGDPTNPELVARYLGSAYRQYIEKMHEIGLAGVTMTYGKFLFLFYDLHEKGLSFNQRFETMYSFLKKDKASMGVSEVLAMDKQLQLSQCDLLNTRLLLCSREGRNYLYVAGSD